MVGGRDNDDVARQFIHLHQQRGDDPLNLAGFVSVAALLPDGVKLVKEQNAGHGPDVVEDALETCGRFSKETTYHRLVAHNEEWDREALRDGFG